MQGELCNAFTRKTETHDWLLQLSHDCIHPHSTRKEKEIQEPVSADKCLVTWHIVSDEHLVDVAFFVVYRVEVLVIMSR